MLVVLCTSRQLGGLQPMTKVNLALFRRFKELTAQGLFAPMMVTNDPLQGYARCEPATLRQHAAVTLTRVARGLRELRSPLLVEHVSL